MDTLSQHFSRRLLTVILLVAAALRFLALDASPPGLNQDEAANAYTTWCLLTTGRDMAGDPWPVFYTHALGGNSSTLFVYWTLPFQAMGGLNIWTTRLPNAVAGVASVLLVYWIGRRLFDTPTGLFAAALLAIQPWTIWYSRWGHEGGLCPLLGMVPVAMMLLCGLLPANQCGAAAPGRILRHPALILFAGVLTGVSCYGYGALRLFIPILVVGLTGVAALAGPSDKRRTVASWATYLTGFAIAFAPLAFQHFVAPDGISRRAVALALWRPHDDWATCIAAVLDRYVRHFAPDFLFVSGDGYAAIWPAGVGPLLWVVAPLLLLGVAALARRRVPHTSELAAAKGWGVSAAVVVVWVLAYPVGDCLHWHPTIHSIRSLPGIGGLVLLAALGGITAFRALQRLERQRIAIAAAVVTLGAAAWQTTTFMRTLLKDVPQQTDIVASFHADLVEVCRWLRPRVGEFDEILITTSGFNQPYVVTLVALQHGPNAWLTEPREIEFDGQWDLCRRYGKFRFERGERLPQSTAQRADSAKRVLVVGRVDEVAGLPWRERTTFAAQGGRAALVALTLDQPPASRDVLQIPESAATDR